MVGSGWSVIDRCCGPELSWISKAYSRVHGYVGITICLIGTVGNVLNILIFGRKKLVSPVNSILRWLSIVDLVVLIIFMPFSWITLVCKSSDVQTYSYHRSVILWYYNYITQTLHTIGIWLTVTLAIWRYIAIAYPLRKEFWCSATSTKRVILSGFLVCPLLCAPLLYTFRIRAIEFTVDQSGFMAKEGNRTTLYYLNPKEPADFVVYLNFVIYSVLLRLVPSVLLILLSFKLVCRLTKSKKIRRQLTRMTIKSDRQMDRISNMILAVLFLFLVNEIPQTVLVLLVIFFGQRVLYQCYHPMGEILDALGLLNSSLHFFLYYAISRQFRNSLHQIRYGCRSSSRVTNEITLSVRSGTYAAKAERLI